LRRSRTAGERQINLPAEPRTEARATKNSRSRRLSPSLHRADTERRAPTPTQKRPSPRPETIDFDGIAARVDARSAAAGKLRRLTAKTGHLFILSARRFITDALPTVSLRCRIFSIRDRKETTLMENVNSYSLSSDGSKIIIGQGAAFTF
jgi:tricorn protease-like protein